MLVLFDHSVPAPLRYALKNHVVVEAVERGWEALGNGALLDAAEAAGFDVFITADKNIRFQQNLALRKIAIVVLGNASGRCCVATSIELLPGWAVHRVNTLRSKFQSAECFFAGNSKC